MESATQLLRNIRSIKHRIGNKRIKHKPKIQHIKNKQNPVLSFIIFNSEKHLKFYSYIRRIIVYNMFL